MRKDRKCCLGQMEAHFTNYESMSEIGISCQLSVSKSNDSDG
jgi:hypothetical protein